MKKKNYILIFKNDAVGDLTQSLNAIDNIIKNNSEHLITLFLSDLSEKFSFLIPNQSINYQKLNHNLSILEKVKLFFFIMTNKVSKIYILAPHNFYFFLSFIYRNVKFYGFCVDGLNNYKRPNLFFRKFLYKYVINDRSAIFKRKSTKDLQIELTKDKINKNYEFRFNLNLNKSDVLKKYLPKNYIYFHIKKKITDQLGWGIKELNFLFDELLKYFENVVLTKDLGKDSNTEIFKNRFNVFDFSMNVYKDNKSKIIFFDNIEGVDLYNLIKYSRKIVAFHGMMTNLASLEKKPVLDLFHCNINNIEDYRKYRNSFYEFKPSYRNYDFIIPSKDIKKTIRKMAYSLNKSNNG